MDPISLTAERRIQRRRHRRVLQPAADGTEFDVHRPGPATEAFS